MAPQQQELPQLQMVWPLWRLGEVLKPVVPDGYRLRTYTGADEVAYIALMGWAGFGGWDHEQVEKLRARLFPGGFFVVDHGASGALVATAQAGPRPTDLHPRGAELGWVAASPAHGRRGLGLAVCAAATGLMLRRGCRDIYLSTDDHRLAAVKTYLMLGYLPFLYTDGMERRWRRVVETLRWNEWRPVLP
jgi:mycothiol synthase